VQLSAITSEVFNSKKHENNISIFNLCDVCWLRDHESAVNQISKELQKKGYVENPRVKKTK
jgi:hypothetical protein